MVTKHTPGEWTVENGLYLNVTNGKNGFVIAQITKDSISHFIGNIEEAEANAKIIAAAPKLLAALNKAEDYILDSIREACTEEEAVEKISNYVLLKEIRAAINKATV